MKTKNIILGLAVIAFAIGSAFTSLSGNNSHLYKDISPNSDCRNIADVCQAAGTIPLSQTECLNYVMFMTQEVQLLLRVTRLRLSASTTNSSHYNTRWPRTCHVIFNSVIIKA